MKSWEHTNNSHHAVIFVFCYMAMVDEISDIKPPEVDPNRYAGERMLWVAVPIRNLHHIHELVLNGPVDLAAVNLEVVL